MLVLRDGCIQGESMNVLNLVSQSQLICFSFIIFFKKGGSAYISCCHLEFGKLEKSNSSLILLQDITFPLLSNNW